MPVALSFVDPFFFVAVALLSIGSAGIGIGIPLQGYIIGSGGGPGPPGEDGLLIDGSSTSYFLLIDADNWLKID